MEARTESRTGAVIAVIVGIVVLATVTAGAVVAFGHSSSSALPNSAVPSSGGPGTAGTRPSSKTASPSPAATAAPSPTHTLKGTVDGGRHRGDLRYFLLTPPAGAEVYGDEEGSELSRSEVADSAEMKRVLADHGFKAAAQRTFLTGDGDYEVSVQLVRFADTGSATAYYSGLSYQGTRITLPSAGPAKAYRLSSASAESTGSVIVLSHQGDVHITLSVTGAKTPGKDLLARLLDQQYRRLKTGR